MSHETFKAPKRRRNQSELQPWSTNKRKRTKEDFFTFCNIVLQYTQYESMRQEEARSANNESPLDSAGGSLIDSSEVSSMGSPSQNDLEDEPNKSDLDSSASSITSYKDSNTGLNYGHTQNEDSELITCFCMKPFAGRPMIECNDCGTWVHLSCAKIRKTQIPDTFTCNQCKENKYSVRKSYRSRPDKSPDGTA